MDFFCESNFLWLFYKEWEIHNRFPGRKITEEKTHWSLESLVSSGYEDNDAFSPEHYYTNKKNITHKNIIQRLGVQ